jgi:hypothetical protein
MEQPTEADFKVQTSDSGVVATFNPTKSDYTFYRLAVPDDIARYGSIMFEKVRHTGPRGDTGDYRSHEVGRMAYHLAARAAACHEMRRPFPPTWWW